MRAALGHYLYLGPQAPGVVIQVPFIDPEEESSVSFSDKFPVRTLYK